MVNKNQIVIFGAGKIGRSFIGQLFGCSGYEVVFIDVDPVVITGLNEKGSYRVVIKGETDEEIIVPNVSAISAMDKEAVIEAVSKADILAVSVGKNVLERIVPGIAAGIEKRSIADPNTPLDIILAENMRSAADFVRGILVQDLPLNFPVDKLVGLVETSIGKMVPIIPQAELEKDPLVVFAEAYNSLILDEKGFKNQIPNVNGLAPKSNIKAWVDRKAFVHNLGHATAAYFGYSKHPDAVYMYEVLEDVEVLSFTRKVMLQSAKILLAAYPNDFTMEALEAHIDDLLYRFRNKALKDTIFRVGMDLPRKLGSNDRFMGAIHLGMELRMPFDLIVEAMSYGFNFKARDESGNGFPPDIAFLESLEKDFKLCLSEQLAFDSVLDQPIVQKLMIFKDQYVY
jgi:mannitol-1-phosphate 5-dehydrogenase